MSTPAERYVETSEAQRDALHWFHTDATADQLSRVAQVFVVLDVMGIPKWMRDPIIRTGVQVDDTAAVRLEHLCNAAIEFAETDVLSQRTIELIVDAWLDTAGGQQALDVWTREENVA